MEDKLRAWVNGDKETKDTTKLVSNRDWKGTEMGARRYEEGMGRRHREVKEREKRNKKAAW